MDCVEEEVAAALPLPKSPPDAGAVVAGVEDAAVLAGLAPKREGPPALAVAGVDDAGCELLEALPPPKRPEDVPPVLAGGFAPKRPDEPPVPPAADCCPPNRPEEAGAAVVEGADDSVPLGLAAPPPKSPPADGAGFAAAFPKRPPAGLPVSAGGAPAGVVDGRDIVGFAGVAFESVADLFPNMDGPDVPDEAPPNRPELAAGAAAAGAVVV